LEDIVPLVVIDDELAQDVNSYYPDAPEMDDSTSHLDNVRAMMEYNAGRLANGLRETVNRDE